MMVTLLLYCYATGTRSSRKIMRRCQVDVACRIIVGDDIPDFRTISDFRKTHLARLEGTVCRGAQALRLGRTGQGGNDRLGRDQGQSQRLGTTRR